MGLGLGGGERITLSFIMALWLRVGELGLGLVVECDTLADVGRKLCWFGGGSMAPWHWFWRASWSELERAWGS